MLAAVGLGLALAGCGQSEEEKARDEVCEARDDIQTNVEERQDLTLGTATVDQVKSNLNAIRDDLTEISDAQDQLSDSQKQQVQKANETFKSQLKSLAEDPGPNRVARRRGAAAGERLRGARDRVSAVVYPNRLRVRKRPGPSAAEPARSLNGSCASMEASSITHTPWGEECRAPASRTVWLNGAVMLAYYRIRACKSSA